MQGSELRWEHIYRSIVRLADLIILGVALRVGLVFTDSSLAGQLPAFITVLTGGIMVASMTVLWVWPPRIVGQGADELRRVARAVLAAAVVLSLTALVFEVGYFQPWVFGVLPATGSFLLISCYALRSVLPGKRARDRGMRPALMEVTGRGLSMSPGYELTLLHVSPPTFTGMRFTGTRWVGKAVVDRVVTLLALLALGPLLLAAAVAIKIEDGGPVLCRQQRVGQAGKRFWMLKFRSTVLGAERMRAGLEAVDEGAGPLCTLRRDPRVTRIGELLRRYSLDELPQLINVLRGEMSLIGPRPPLPAEVERYGSDARRRLLVQPGLTGLWQVSGRSELTWEEAVRLDLRYIENWSLAMDAMIMWKTVGAVLGGRGAY